MNEGFKCYVFERLLTEEPKISVPSLQDEDGDVHRLYLGFDRRVGDRWLVEELVQARPAAMKRVQTDGEFAVARLAEEGEIFLSSMYPIYIADDELAPITGDVPAALLQGRHGAVIDDLDWFLRGPIADKIIAIAARECPEITEEEAFSEALEIAHEMLVDEDVTSIEEEDLVALAERLLEELQ